MLVEYSIRAEAEIIKIAKIIVLAKNTPKALGGLENICCTRTFLDFF
jgi:hypothetical protein